MKFSMSCVKGMACDNYIELLVHPIKKMIAIRPTTKENRCAIQWTGGGKTSKEPRNISCKAYIDTLFQIFGWNPDYKFKLYGCIYREGKDAACIFTTTDAGVYIKKDQILAAGIDVNGKFLSQSGKRIRAVTRSSDSQFGPDYYEAKSMRDMVQQTREEWQTRIDGQLCSTGEKLNVTPYEELRAFIQQELGELFEEVQPE